MRGNIDWEVGVEVGVEVEVGVGVDVDVEEVGIVNDFGELRCLVMFLEY